MNTFAENLDTPTLCLLFGLTFEDLYQRDGLIRLDQSFLQELKTCAPLLEERLVAARQNPGALTAKLHSELIIELAPYLEDFLGHLFGIEQELREL